MPDQELVKLGYDLLPGFGAFGWRPPLRKSLKVDGQLGRISLFFDSGSIQKYRFPAIHLFGRNGKEIPIAKVVMSVEASSRDKTQTRDDLMGLLLSRKPIDSGSEARPELKVRFKGPVYLSRIEFAHGRHKFGGSAQHLCMNGYLNNRIVLSHRNNDPKLRVAALKDVHQDLNIPVPDKPLSADGRKAHCRRVRNAILQKLDEGVLGWSALQFAQLLPVYEKNPDLTPFRLRISAETMIATLGREMSARTPVFRILSTLLSTPERLEQIVAEANRLLSARLHRPVEIVASKHFFQEPLLLRKRDSFLAALDRSFPILEACGVTPMLCYGTLLGAVRNNAFLGHDDDVDLLYFDGSRSRKEMIAKAAVLVEALAQHGFKSDFNPDFENSVHFHIRDENGSLDLFPCWQEGRKVRVVMKNPEYRPVPLSVILPTSTVNLYGRTYPAPADPAAFLAERYGPGWSVPDPYYEWPWVLEKPQT